MNNLRRLLEQVFFPQVNHTVTLSFGNNQAAQNNILDVLERLKHALASVGIDKVSFNADKAMVSIVTTEDKKDEILRISQDFGATITQSDF
jgi:hypothetical protein